MVCFMSLLVMQKVGVQKINIVKVHMQPADTGAARVMRSLMNE